MQHEVVRHLGSWPQTVGDVRLPVSDDVTHVIHVARDLYRQQDSALK